MLNNPALLEKARVVYHDDNYPTIWINRSSSLVVANELVSKGFIKLDADSLSQWMTHKINSSTANQAVLVMSQDVAPDAIFEAPRADCLARRFLNAGGRIVWLGDVPFFYQGQQTHTTDGTPIPGGGKDEIGWKGQHDVLGSYSSVITSDGKVSIKQKGKKIGLNTDWNSERPVIARNLYKGKPLATTRICPVFQEEDVNPQYIRGRRLAPNSADSLTLGSAIGSLGTMVTALVLLISVFLPFFDPENNKLSWSGIISLVATIFAVGYLVFILFKVKWAGRFISAWISKYDKGEFIRIWDFANLEPTGAMIDELYKISINDR